MRHKIPIRKNTHGNHYTEQTLDSNMNIQGQRTELLVTRKKYEKVKRYLENERNERAKEREDWEVDRMKFVHKIAKMVKHIENAGKSKGRNMHRRVDFDGFDHANNANIGTFIRFVFFPHHKFPHHSWSLYLPDEERSMFRRLITEVDIPEHCIPSLYWKDNIVPLVNKKLQECRSSLVSKLRDQYMCEYC